MRSRTRFHRFTAALACALALLVAPSSLAAAAPSAPQKPRVIVTSDAEIDDQCSLVRFLLYANEWDIEGIITTSSQYRWQGHKWPGDHWYEPYLDAYAQVHPNLVKHDPAYPIPAYLRSVTVLGNAGAEGDLAAPSPGSDLIVRSLLNRSDPRPVWLQAWGGVNTIARALKTIEEQHPERMAEVASKCRLFLIWEQDDTFQRYIRPVWGKFGILTIISDQFEAIAYRWKQAQPAELHRYFEGPWMRSNILRQHGPLTALYHAHENGDFRSEGDSPAFLHTIPTGLRSLESPDFGGWGGRYVRIRENTWLDPVPVPGYAYPRGRWWGHNGWGRLSLRPESTSTEEQRREYFKPMWQWTVALQNDFAARADWCVKEYKDANHPPVVRLAHAVDLSAKPGATITLSAAGTTDPDGDTLTYRWWHYEEAGSHKGRIDIRNADQPNATFTVPANAAHARTLHLICEVTDNGSPALTRYQRVIVTVDNPLKNSGFALNAAGAAEIPPMSAHFPLDGGKGNVVTEVISGHGGKLANADPAVAFIASDLGGALRLGGQNDRVVVPHHPAFDFGDESFSITFWVRWPKGLRSGHERFLTKGDYDKAFPGETGKRYEFYLGSGDLRFVVDDDAESSRIQVSAAPFLTGEWVHLAAVRDRTARRLKLYANGVLLPTSNPGNPAADGTDRTGSISNPRPLYIGDSTREDAPFQGDLDDLRFFRHALTAEHVAALAARVPLVESAAAARPTGRAPAAVAPADLPPPSAHLPLTEGEGRVIHERVLGVHGALLNADPDRAWTSSDRGLALRLDGIDDRVEVPASPGFEYKAESFSVAFHLLWLKGATPRLASVLSKRAEPGSASLSAGKGWAIDLSPGGLVFRVEDGVVSAQLEVPATAFLTGQWVHVVAVRDASDHRLRLYLNGERQQPIRADDQRVNGIGRTGDLSNARPLTLGAGHRGENPLSGELADLRFYRAALTDAQAAAVSRLRRNAASNPAEISQPKR